MVMAMVMNLYSAFSIDIFKCALQASDLWVRSDISIPVYTRLLLHKLIFVRLSRTTKPPSFYGHRSIQKGSVQCNKQSMLPVPRGPCVRKLFTGLIMYLPSQNKEHCIVLYCIVLYPQYLPYSFNKATRMDAFMALPI